MYQNIPKFELIDKITNEQILIFSMKVSLYGITIINVREKRPFFPKNMEDELERNIYLYDFLMNRFTYKFKDYFELDEYIINRLGINHTKPYLGRMNDYKHLICLLDYFETPDDTYKVYPLKNEVFSFIDEDTNFPNIYLLDKREDKI